MKVVVAEKISSSAVDLLREPRWTIVTADQLDGNLPAQLESADALSSARPCKWMPNSLNTLLNCA